MNIFETLIVQPIFNLLIVLYSVIPGADFGIALILFTILIRFALWPLVVKQLHQVRAMRKLQPELAKIRKQSKGNRQAEGMKMLELYKKHDVKPLRAFGLILIQLPIFLALFQVIQIFTSHRDRIADFTYGFLENIPAIQTLIQNPQDFNERLLGIVDLTEHAISSNGVNIFLVILALVAAYTQYLISKQTAPQTSTKRLRDVMAEAADGKQPDQAELNAVVMTKMIKFLPIFLFFVMMSLPGALALYYVTSNIFAAIQQHFILKRNVEEMETIADQAETKAEGKKATAKASARAAKAQEGTITRIVAKDTPRKSKKG